MRDTESGPQEERKMTGKQRTTWTLRGYADFSEGTVGKREPKFSDFLSAEWGEAEDAYAAGTRSAALDAHRAAA